MTAHQTAVINGLLAENFGKNDLIRTAEAQSRAAQSRANDAARAADSLRMETGTLAAKIEFLKRSLNMPSSCSVRQKWRLPHTKS